MFANVDECKAAGLDPKKVERVARGLSKWGKEAEKLGIYVFGGSGSGTLRLHDPEEPHHLIVADLACPLLWDGGAGDPHYAGDGLLRGE